MKSQVNPIFAPIESVKQFFPAAETIFRQDDPAMTMILIITGTVRIVKDDVVIAHRGPGELIGEMSLIEESTRFASVVADTDCELLICDRDQFLEILRQDPGFALTVLKGLSHKLRESDLTRVAELEANNEYLTHANTALVRSNDFLEQLISQSPAGVIVTDREYNINRANQAASKIFDTDLSSTSNIFLSYFAEVDLMLNHLNEGGRTWTGECKITTERNTKTLFLSVSVLTSATPDDTLLFICDDISELIELNQRVVQLERFATEGEISGEIAHDIKNYLTVFKGNLGLIEERIDEQNKANVKKYLDAMNKCFGEISRFVEKLMSNRSDDGKVVEVDLSEVVSLMVKFLRPHRKFCKIKMSMDVMPGFPKAILINEIQIQQVLLNLLLNAADAINECSDERTGEISVNLEYDRECGRLIVQDNGPGIAADRQSNLFAKRFTTKERGHGIGLITVKKIIDQHHGTIQVESEPGQGTKFIISLPLGN